MSNNSNLTLKQWIAKQTRKKAPWANITYDDTDSADREYVIEHKHPSVEHKSVLVSAKDLEPEYFEAVKLTDSGLVYVIEGDKKIWTNQGEFNV